ncbi:Nrap protein [Patellaria atrata CBS 101060]|uniref:U3 small nucleolar RNA-associated protein 22 n=1 Tax=Patellaria atrata CBS 101060 TaxID=1346257 RepID=A0A9P4VSI1_9PEZI|nr:Nrap protein [Patellaria atrata CBS 101060]
MALPTLKRQKLNHNNKVGFRDENTKADIKALPTETHQGQTNPTESQNKNGRLEADVESDSEEDDYSSKQGELPPGEVSKGCHTNDLPVHKKKHRLKKTATGVVYYGETFKSNIFKLQVDALIDDYRAKSGRKWGSVDKFLHSLKNVITQLPNREPLSVADAERSLIKSTKVAIPFPTPRPPPDARYKLEYKGPEAINVTGSYVLGTAERDSETFSIDLVVVMPSALFQEKDYMNYRFFHKRAYFLACIAAGIKISKDHTFELTFDYLNENRLHPIIKVKSSNDPSRKNGIGEAGIIINIIAAGPEGLFPSEKTLPNRNCIRPHNDNGGATSKTLVPTSFYNSSLRADTLVLTYLKLHHETARECDAYRDACILGRSWLKQRGLGSKISAGGFGNFEWSTLVALLLGRNGTETHIGDTILSPGYSSYQLFKGTLKFLASRDVYKNPYVFQTPDLRASKTAEAPIIFDGARGLNILFKMTQWSYNLLQHEAQITMAMLGESSFDQFRPTFLLKNNQTLLRFDVCLRIPIGCLFDYSGDKPPDSAPSVIYQKLYSTLERGLGDRVKIIHISPPPAQEWRLGAFSASNGHQYATIGLVVDPAQVARLVDHGPSAEDHKSAASFRQFWGEKAELRRFKDGSILESLVWTIKDDKSSVIEQIIAYILLRHFGENVVKQVKYLTPSARDLFRSDILGTTPFQPIMVAFSTLEKHIRSLENLPLRIRQVLAVSPSLRYTSTEVPTFGPGNPMAQPADVVIQFEGSGRWPDDLIAIQRTKIAFLVKLAELLEQSVEGISVRVGLENVSSDYINQSFLDVIYAGGAAFRLRIYHDREQMLLERLLGDKFVDAGSKSEAALALLRYKKDFLRTPSLSQSLQTLCTRHPMLSPTVRLVKRWFARHLLEPHFAPDVIELFVARTFLQPYPWRAPSSIVTGFLRTLFFLARWDWRSEPWIVDFGDDMKPDNVATIMTRFEAWRKVDPAMNRMVLFVASNFDLDGSTYTNHCQPTKVVASRMTALARAADEAFNSCAEDFDLGTLFASSLGDYDFVLELNPKFTKLDRVKHKRTGQSQYKNLQSMPSDENIVNLAHDPIDAFVRELQEIYGHAIVFFWDLGFQGIIAGLWNPSAGARQWKVKLDYSTKPLQLKSNGDESAHVDINKEAILNEIARLGGEMVQSVTTKDA